ncbi:MAG: alpha/beta hydrolase [Thermoplasmata archaeon]|nr:alpha/beta hydrolase [Thermoplasmata archaeon]
MPLEIDPIVPMRTVRGIPLAYEVHGVSGDPVVLVHGSLADRRSWDQVVPGLSQSMEVVTYDRRGHGDSGTAPRPHPVSDDAADLAALLEELNVFPAHVVAHSYGGAVALRLASERPEMVRSVAIHEPPFIGLLADDPTTESEGQELLDGARRLQEMIRAGQRTRAAELLVGMYSDQRGAWDRLPTEAQQSVVRSLYLWSEEFNDPAARAPDRAASRELMLPALLTVGSESPGFLHDIARELGGLLRNSQVLEIPGAGSVPQIVRPHQYNGILVTFLLERNVPGS